MPPPSVPVPLRALFGKADVAVLKVSPNGKHLAWLARSVEGALELWHAPLPLPSTATDGFSIPGARQLTASAHRSNRRDICFSFTFTVDDARILYLRETEHGSELYHLFAIDIAEARQQPVEAGVDLLAAHPQLTCSVGFVGGLQLWLPRSDPGTVVLATGRGSLLWDLSTLDVQTATLSTVYTNPASSRLGLLRLGSALLLHVLVVGACRLLARLTLGLAASVLPLAAIEACAPPPAAPCQYFVDAEGEMIGSACAAFGLPPLSGLVPAVALRFCKRLRNGRLTPCCPDVPFSKLNMQARVHACVHASTYACT